MKTIKITPPEGYEIDQERSSFEEIVFKPVVLKRKENVITNLPINSSDNVHINGRWAFSIFTEEEQGGERAGSKIAGHLASLFLCNSEFNGAWYDSDGNVVKDYLFWKPSNK